MCGRYALKATAAELIEHFKLLSCPEFGLRFNIAPQSMIPVIRQKPGCRPRRAVGALGFDSFMGQRPEHRQQAKQRPGRDGSREAGISLQLRQAPLPDTSQRLLRMAAGRGQEAALLHSPDRLRWILCLRWPTGRMDTASRRDSRFDLHHHNRAERGHGAHSRPHAGHPAARAVRRMARSRATTTRPR